MVETKLVYVYTMDAGCGIWTCSISTVPSREPHGRFTASTSVDLISLMLDGGSPDYTRSNLPALTFSKQTLALKLSFEFHYPEREGSFD